MEGLRFGQSGEKQRSLRAWIIILVVLPPAFLGAAYFLFVEYVLQGDGPIDPTLLLTLRLGGVGLIVVALVLAGAFGYLLVDRVTRPLRLLLRLAESGDLASNRSLFERERGLEILELHRLLSVLINQNKAGAQAMEELERLKASLSTLREELGRTGQHGIPPRVTVSPVVPLGEISAGLEGKRVQLLSFFRELRDRVVSLKDEVLALGLALGFQTPAPTPSAASASASPSGSLQFPTSSLGFGSSPPSASTGAGLEPGEPADPMVFSSAVTAEERQALESRVEDAEPALVGSPLAQVGIVRDAVERTRRLGAVLALEAARLGGSVDRVQVLRERFEAGLGDLEGTLAVIDPSSDGEDARAEAERRRVAEERWVRLLEHLSTLERLLGEVEER